MRKLVIPLALSMMLAACSPGPGGGSPGGSPGGGGGQPGGPGGDPGGPGGGGGQPGGPGGDPGGPGGQPGVEDAAGAAASAAVINSGGTTAASLQEDWDAALSTAAGESFELTITEAQLEDQILLAASAYSSGTVRSVDVIFDNGLSTLVMEVDAEGVATTITAVFTVTANASGDLEVTTQSVTISAGPVNTDAPPQTLDEVNTLIETAFTEAQGVSSVDVTFTSVVTDNGVMIIRGTINS